MVIWSDRIDDIIEDAQAFEAKLIKLVWKSRPTASTASGGNPLNSPSGQFASMNQSTASLGRVGQGSRLGHVHGLPQSVLDEVPQEPEKEKLASTPGEERDVEALKPTPRPTRIFAAIYNGISSGLAIFFVGSLGASLAKTAIQLIVFRALTGVAGGGLMTIAQMIVSDVVPLRERGKYQGILGSVVALANGIGPIIGGALASQSKDSWRWIFRLNLPLTVLTTLCALFLMPLKKVEGD